MAESSHYDLLGVSPQASREEIRRAYARRARARHPDAHPDADPVKAEWARRQMAALNDAWKVLRDPDRRQAYDAELARSRSNGHGHPADPVGRPWMPGHVGNDFEAFHRGSDGGIDFNEPDLDAGPGRPGDLMLLAPVGILVLAAAMFAFGLMTESQLLWAFPLLLVPVAGVAFLGVQLMVMRRSATAATARNRSRREGPTSRR